MINNNYKNLSIETDKKKNKKKEQGVLIHYKLK